MNCNFKWVVFFISFQVCSREIIQVQYAFPYKQKAELVQKILLKTFHIPKSFVHVHEVKAPCLTPTTSVMAFCLDVKGELHTLKASEQPLKALKSFSTLKDNLDLEKEELSTTSYLNQDEY